jgi:23S rRNA (cytosine1962-C5)-methyltransferase
MSGAPLVDRPAIDAPGTASLLVPWRVERILRDDGARDDSARDDGAQHDFAEAARDERASSQAPRGENGFLVVDKPQGITVHGGDEARGDDVVGRLATWLRAQGRDEYLGVHQRLDQATSGLLFFTRERDLNQEVSRAMESHAVGRTYYAVVRRAARCQLARAGRLEHLLEHEKGLTHVVARGGKRAVVGYEIVRQVGERALVRLEPQTGRTHQLRAQLAAVGAPIAGDELYGGEPAPRLMLHAARLEGAALGAPIESAVPACFSTWLESGAVTVSDDVTPALRDAGCLRYALRGKTDTYRLSNGEGDLLPGLVIDVYGAYAVLSVYDAALLDRVETIARQVHSLGFTGVYLKKRVRADLRERDARDLAPEVPLVGEAAPAEHVVTENGMRIATALGDGLSTGLFVDQRDNRERMRAWAAGGRMLNLFSYTCSFSVAAALGGATETVSVDLAGRALDRGRRNFEHNGLDPREHKFWKEDAVKWLARAGRRGERFRAIVLDPPSFSTVGKGTFSVDKRYGEVASLALALLEPGGRLLAVTNHTKTSARALRKILHDAAREARRGVTTMRDLPSGLDCPSAALGPWPSKSTLVTVE